MFSSPTYVQGVTVLKLGGAASLNCDCQCTSSPTVQVMSQWKSATRLAMQLICAITRISVHVLELFNPFNVRAIFSKGPMLNCSMVVKFYKMYLMWRTTILSYCPNSLVKILSNIATFYNNGHIIARDPS